MTPYLIALSNAMTALAHDHNALFVGQSICAGGTVAHRTFTGVPADQLIELPVFESTQLGMSIGLALADPSRPVLSFFPRINFLLEAAGQLVSHLDKMPLYAGINPRVIIRTAIATSTPLDPGPQHVGDYAPALRTMLSTIDVVELNPWPEDIAQIYERAATRDGATVIVENMRDYFDD